MVRKWIENIICDVALRQYGDISRDIQNANKELIAHLDEIKITLKVLSEENDKLRKENEQLKRASQQTDVKNIVSEWLGGV